MRKDKKQVIGEDMTDEQVRRYLQVEPPAGTHRDFHALERAYRGLRAHDFERFLQFFVAEGRDPNAVNPEGLTLADLLARHANSGEYLDSLRRVGAR